MAKENKRFTILGAGAYGTALSAVLARKGWQVTLVARREETARQINEERANRERLPGVPLPSGIRAVTSPAEGTDGAALALLAVPSLYALDTVRAMMEAPSVREGETLLGVVTKGFIDTRTGPSLLVQTLENYLPGFYKDSTVYLSGPSHAEELARGRLTGLISACRNPRNSIQFRQALASDSLKVFSSLDVVGVQIAAALKNIVALGFGILDALKEKSEFFGDNAESLLLAVGLNEIQTMGRALGASHPETFTSIAGVGDLDVTCRSQYGRNRRFGREIIVKDILAPYGSLDELIRKLDQIGYLPEGVIACRSANSIITQKKLKLPLLRMVYRILNREADPATAIKDLMDEGPGLS